MKTKLIAFAAMLAVNPFALAGDQDIYITELMYKGLFGEFVEVTNTGAASVSLSGWSFDDDSRAAGTVALPNVTLAQNDTIVITEVSEAVFKQAWYTDSLEGQPASLEAVLQNNSVNLGRNDEVNIYDDSTTPILIDRLTFNDEAASGTNPDGPRTEDVSAVPGPSTVLGDNIFKNWVLSVAGTGNAWKSGAPAPVAGTPGSPGQYPN